MGQPYQAAETVLTRGVYPHLRGAAGHEVERPGLVIGISPPAWGSPLTKFDQAKQARYIPTCVGQPGTYPVTPRIHRVYPHLRGAAGLVLYERARSLGISPPAWGSHVAGFAPCSSAGYIPTCVGQPHVVREYHRLPRVYPHLRGAAS